MKKLLAPLAALFMAAPAMAVPIELPISLDGRTAWLFSPDTVNTKSTYYLEVLRQDAEGDILVEYTDIHDKRLGYAWVRCSTDQIQFDGGEWEYVDHRNVVGWHSDIACGRPVD